MVAKELESIDEYGFIDPITVRRQGGGFEIIDGEHRWRAATTLGIKEVPVVVLDVDDAQARKLTLVLNELHGQASPDLLSSLLKDLENDLGTDELLKGLPYTDDVLKSFIDLPALPALGSAETSSPTVPGSEEPKERWVEKTYRMPKSAAGVLDDAIEKIRMAELADTGQAIEDWQALERLAAEGLAS